MRKSYFFQMLTIAPNDLGAPKLHSDIDFIKLSANKKMKGAAIPALLGTAFVGSSGLLLLDNNGGDSSESNDDILQLPDVQLPQDSWIDVFDQTGLENFTGFTQDEGLSDLISVLNPAEEESEVSPPYVNQNITSSELGGSGLPNNPHQLISPKITFNFISAESIVTTTVDVTVSSINTVTSATTTSSSVPIVIPKIEIIGTSGNDILNGTADPEIIIGLAGNDELNGNDGEDELFGNEGRDTLNGGDGNDELFGNDDRDTLNGDDGNDFLSGGEDRDTLNGGLGDDILYGDEDNDTLNGDDGNDFLDGGIGNDTLNGDNGDDVLYGKDGNDRLNGDDGNDQIFGGDGNDTVRAGDGNDIINGEDGDDNINGQNGDDNIDGGAGADVIRGGNGDDTINNIRFDDANIRGDGGDDLLIFEFGPETNTSKLPINGNAGTDTLDLTSLSNMNWMLVVNNSTNLLVDYNNGVVTGPALGSNVIQNGNELTLTNNQAKNADIIIGTETLNLTSIEEVIIF